MARAQRHPVTSRHTARQDAGWTPDRPSAGRPHLVVVGVGPRATGILDRIAANADLVPSAGLRIDLVDPHVPGAGRIWDAGQSPLLLMNSRAADVTMFADMSGDLAGPVCEGPSLAQWAQQIRDGVIEAPTAGTARLAEITSLSPTDFPSRRVQALYLEWVFGLATARLPDRVDVHVHRHAAVDLTPAPARSGRRWRVQLDAGSVLTADTVLVTVGHVDAALSDDARGLQDFAARHSATYLPPSQARDAALSAVPAGKDVIMRGMGLGAVDLIALLTQGRGGRFEPAPLPGDQQRLEYRGTGREPRLWIGSRRGVPYHSKVRDEGTPAGPRDLVYLIPQALDAAADENGLVDVERDVVPLIAQEIRRAVSGIDLGPTTADGSRESGGWSLLGPLDDPLAQVFEGPEDAADRSSHSLDGADGQDPTAHRARLARTRDLLVDHIRHDLDVRRGADNDRARALFQVLLRLTGALTRLLPSSRITPASRALHPAVWHSLFSFVCSGPPPHRLRQLLALERAGVVHFLGPRLEVTADDATGTFRARAAGGVSIDAAVLVDAFLPGTALLDSGDPFLRALATSVGAGAPDASDSRHASGRLPTGPTGRVLGPDGVAVPGLWAAGPGTSEIPLGAFARPGTGAPVFRMNDLLARDVLTALRQPVRQVATSAETGDDDLEQDPRVAAASDRSGRAGHAPSPRVAVLGAGRIGTAIARQAVRSGLEVEVRSRRHPRAVRARIPGAAPGHGPADTGPRCAPDVLVLAVPLHAVLAMDPERCSASVVIDATNPWGPEDAAALERARTRYGRRLPDGGARASSTELVAAHLHGARVVKALNHIGYHDLEDQALPTGTPGRRALAIAGDDAEARDLAARFVDRLGFDPVQVQGLSQARHLEPDGAVFGTRSGRDDLAEALRDASARVRIGA
jgi:predicted dinucleotide-binding enzyme/uncharacterized NAD(P)/FAD-binding protein YdhS